MKNHIKSEFSLSKFNSNTLMIVENKILIVTNVYDLIVSEIRKKKLYSIMQLTRRTHIRIQTFILINIIDGYEKIINSYILLT